MCDIYANKSCLMYHTEDPETCWCYVFLWAGELRKHEPSSNWASVGKVNLRPFMWTIVNTLPPSDIIWREYSTCNGTCSCMQSRNSGIHEWLTCVRGNFSTLGAQQCNRWIIIDNSGAQENIQEALAPGISCSDHKLSHVKSSLQADRHFVKCTWHLCSLCLSRTRSGASVRTVTNL